MGFRRRDIEKGDAAARDAARRKHRIEHAGRMVIRGIFGGTRHLEHALAAARKQQAHTQFETAERMREALNGRPEKERTRHDYQKVAVPLVWVVNLKSRTVMVYRRDGSVSRLRETDELSGEDVIPGFLCPVRDLFPPRKAPAPVAPNGLQ